MQDRQTLQNSDGKQLQHCQYWILSYVWLFLLDIMQTEIVC